MDVCKQGYDSTHGLLNPQPHKPQGVLSHEKRARPPAVTGIRLLSSTCGKSPMNRAPGLDASGELLDNIYLSRRPNYLSPIPVRLPNIRGHEPYLASNQFHQISHPHSRLHNAYISFTSSSPYDSISLLTSTSSSKSSK